MARLLNRPAAAALLAAALPAQAGGWLDAPDSSDRPPFLPHSILEAGVNLHRIPHAGWHREFRRSWQAGAEIRSWAAGADSAADYIPEIGLVLRKLWLGAEVRHSLQNSEYGEIGVGVFAGSRLLTQEQALGGASPSRIWPRPFFRLAVGKYWSPVADFPLGIDVGLGWAHYFSAIPPGHDQIDLITATLSAFYRLGPRR